MVLIGQATINKTIQLTGHVAQLDRASDYESGGRRFEPCLVRLIFFPFCKGIGERGECERVVDAVRWKKE